MYRSVTEDARRKKEKNNLEIFENYNSIFTKLQEILEKK